jgi:hypothetical protein
VSDNLTNEREGPGFVSAKGAPPLIPQIEDPVEKAVLCDRNNCHRCGIEKGGLSSRRLEWKMGHISNKKELLFVTKMTNHVPVSR